MNATTAQQIDGQLALDFAELDAQATTAERAEAVVRNELDKVHPDWARVRTYAAKVFDAKLAAQAAAASIAQGRAEFAKAGGWTRYYLVANAGGHVHNSRSCSTCRPTTQFVWLTEYSGLTAEELVELAGERACTVCFPEAPVAALARESRLRYDVEAREAKAAAKAAKDAEAAAKLAKAGGALLEPVQVDAFTTVKTVRAAKVEAVNALVDYLERGNVVNRRMIRENVEALAALRDALVAAGVDWSEYRVELERKAAAKARKNAREAAKLAARLGL